MTDDAGCSTATVFTGQTAYCNGSAAARTTHTITVPPVAVPLVAVPPVAVSNLRVSPKKVSIAGRKVYPDHTVYCGTKFFVHGVAESLREYLSAYDVRVVVISPGIIETEVLDQVTDPKTLANYKANKAAIEGGVGPEHVAELMLQTYNLPQRVLVQEICITPTRQRY